MATTSTATSNFSSTVVADVKAAALANLRAKYAHVLVPEPVKANYEQGTNSFTYVTFPDIAPSTTALTEGTPPTANALAITVESFTASQIGATVELTDLVVLQSPQNLMAIAVERMGDNAAHTQDRLVREILAAGASVFYGGTATSRATVAVSHVLTGALVKRMVEELQTANVPTFGNGNFRSIIHARQAGDLQRDTSTAGYVDIFKANSNAGALLNGNPASFGGVDFVITSDAKSFQTAGASSANVYAGLFFGPGCYAWNDMQVLNAYRVNFGGDHTDPIGQKAIVGWKMAFGAKLLTGPGAKIMRLETGATYG